MALQPGSSGKAVLKQLGKQSLIFRERDDAVAHVARRKHVELFTEAAARATVIADGDDRIKLANTRRLSALWSSGVFFEPFEKSRKPGAAPDSDHAQRFRAMHRPGFSHEHLADLSDFFFGGTRYLGARIGVEQLGEARIFRQILEIGIVARLKTQSRIQANGA